jgi:myo-inositol-1(or 4)-monophosphatase
VRAADVAEVLEEAAAAVVAALGSTSDWGLAGTRPGQYRSDLAADEAALGVLHRAGFPVLSEESGLSEAPSGVSAIPGAAEALVVVDPLDGSTNASRGIPWYATSLCVLDRDGPFAALVVNLSSGVSYTAARGEGARRDGRLISPSGCHNLGQAVVGLSGFPRRYLGWKQFRALGAVALDLCAVADGTLDGYVDFGRAAHGVWDYLGGMLVCAEAGAVVADAFGRSLVVRTHEERRTPVAGATEEVASRLVAARREGEEAPPGSG